MQRFRNGWARSAVALGMLFSVGAAIEISKPAAFAQTAVTGSINGTVTDSTGAVVPNAAVTVKDMQTGAVINLTSNADGRFTAPFLKPDTFAVSATAPGLQSVTTSVQVLVGQQSAVNLTVTPTASTQTVQVSANNAQLIDTQTANMTTTFTTQQFRNLPMPGGDITTIAYTVPGVTVNAGGAYGNFESQGLPGLSNLVIINGADDNDPFLNLNNSGSSNLTLGQQEIAQASVVQNGYSVEYGRQAGVIETYVTKSGTNRVHGLLQWNYNSAGLNANDFFNKQNGLGRSKAVSNQYAAQIGGPILHNKLFFFVDTEGLRYVLPSGGYVNYPSPAFQQQILSTVSADSANLYGTIFKTMQGSPNYANAVPVTSGSGSLQDQSYNKFDPNPKNTDGLGGCGSYAGTAVVGQANTYFGANPNGPKAPGTVLPCVNAIFANAENLNREWVATGRFDWNISDKHKVFVRITDDQGKQPSFTSLIVPVWDDQSIQPTYSGQLNDTYTFTPNLTNQLILTGLYYSAIFEPANLQATLASSPSEFVDFSDGGTNSAPGVGQNSPSLFGFTVLGAQYGTPFAYPQGRNVTQYQIVDDASWLKGNHAFKFGGNLRRDDVTDVGNEGNSSGGYYQFGGLADFAGGVLPGSFNSFFTQSFPTVPVVHSALYNLGVYAQDEWRAKSNLVVDYGVRVDRTGNPACTTNCYSHYAGGFPASGATLDTPYNATLSVGHRGAFPAIEKAVIQPRAGFNWDTKGDGKTVVRGGVGLFADEFPATIVTGEYGSFPNVFAPTVLAGNVGTGAGSAAAFASAANTAITSGFSQGGSANSIAGSLPPGVPFSPPNYVTTVHTFHSPRYLEFSLQLQKQLTTSDAVIVSYAGNHGYDLLIPNTHLNQNVTGGTYAATSLYGLYGNGTFQDVPTSQADPRFLEVSKTGNNAISDYNGVSFEYKHIDRRGIDADLSYTYSHALDDVSNGGAGLPTNGGSITSQIVPNSVSQLMYSNSDYDVRHNFLADVTYAEPNHFNNKIEDLIAGGWTLAGKAYWRSGEPFSVVNQNANNALFNGTGGTTVLADVLNSQFNHFCNSYSRPCFQTPGIFNGQGLTFDPATGTAVPIGPGPSPQMNFGNVPRNAFYGPHYADVDLSVYKDVIRHGSTQFQVGTQVYNVFNHVNFAAPLSNASNANQLGRITGDISAPTSPYGSFQGSVVSGRVLVVQGRLLF